MSFHIRSVTLKDFGPYRGEHEIDFGEDRGVWIIYGPNGRGKTRIHSAIRYALYGEIRGRMGPETPDEAANEPTRDYLGYPSFRVDVEFDVGGDSYVVRRGHDGSRASPDYLSLERNGAVLSRNEAPSEMARMFPPALSQFFLLDAEDLKPYENLIREQSEAGEKLKSSIERLLGIPALKAAADDVEVLHTEALGQVTAEARANEATNKLAEALSVAEEIRDGLGKELRRETWSLEQRRDELTAVDRQLADNETATKAFAESDSARRDQGEAEESHREAETALAELLPGLWSTVLAPLVRFRRETNRRDMITLSEKLAQSVAASKHSSHLDDHETCPTCGTSLNADAHLIMLERARAVVADLGDPADLAAELADLQASTRVFTAVADADRHDLLSDREIAVGAAALRIESAKARLEEAEEVLRRTRGVDVRELIRQRDDLKLQIQGVSSRVDGLRDKIAEQNQQIDNIRTEIRATGFAADPLVEKMEKVADDLVRVLHRAADVYRDKLKDAVERRASEIFSRISSEPDYVGLEINDHFGLTILDKDGRPVPGRSAGYEHLVALSLIAALQKSAPIQGAVVMDNPFLRLDTDHTRKVIPALSEVADQVILLTFPGEFDRDAAVAALDDELLGEYQLERITSRSTAIKKGRA